MCTKIPRESTHLTYPAICFSVKEVNLNAVCKLSNWRQDYKMNHFHHHHSLIMWGSPLAMILLLCSTYTYSLCMGVCAYSCEMNSLVN